MITNQILQSTLEGIKEITGIDFSVFDPEGKLIYTVLPNVEPLDDAIITVASKEDSCYINGAYYFMVYDEGIAEYILCAKGSEDPQTDMAGRMTAMQLESLNLAYKERYDKENFIKNLLLDNLLMVDIYNRAKKLHIRVNAPRVAFSIETKNEKDTNALEILRTMFGNDDRDFITAIDERNIVLVKELPEDAEEADLDQIANTIVDMLNAEAMSQVHVAYGTIVDEIKKVSTSYKESKLALEIGKIFNSEETVVGYSSLGIGRLIYQLPLPMCKMFIQEIFHGRSPEAFDEETLATINQFFENSLNVSETSRQLYIHRNTLVYRLDKLQKQTGLDLRVFDDAITFKIALMVVKYMNYMEH